MNRVMMMTMMKKSQTKETDEVNGEKQVYGQDYSATLHVFYNFCFQEKKQRMMMMMM